METISEIENGNEKRGIDILERLIIWIKDGKQKQSPLRTLQMPSQTKTNYEKAAENYIHLQHLLQLYRKQGSTMANVVRYKMIKIERDFIEEWKKEYHLNG